MQKTLQSCCQPLYVRARMVSSRIVHNEAMFPQIDIPLHGNRR
jgi:hypothetical protein